MKSIFWGLLASVLLFGACVPNKRIVYLQNSTEPKRGEFNNKDSVSRQYKTHFKEYVLRKRDIISVNIASITPKDLDFVKKYEEQLGTIRYLTQYNPLGQAGANQNGNRNSASGGRGNAAGLNNPDGSMSNLALDRLPTGFVVDEEGNLELPYIGKMRLEGLTVPQAEVMMREKLVGYFETPIVRIQLMSFHFTLLGEVTSEGLYTTYDPNSTVLDAIILAGNMTEFADRSRIKIVRTEGDQSTVYYVNALQEDLIGQAGFFLKPDDIIIVPPLGVRSAKKYTIPNYNLGLGIITSGISFILLLLALK